MADFNKPANATSGWLDTFTEIKNAISSVAQMFDGTSDTNVPTGAKRIDSTTKEIFEYNGATWDSLGFVSDTADAGAVAAAAQVAADAAQDTADAAQVDATTAIADAASEDYGVHVDNSVTTNTAILSDLIGTRIDVTDGDYSASSFNLAIEGILMKKGDGVTAGASGDEMGHYLTLSGRIKKVSGAEPYVYLIWDGDDTGSLRNRAGVLKGLLSSTGSNYEKTSLPDSVVTEVKVERVDSSNELCFRFSCVFLGTNDDLSAHISLSGTKKYTGATVSSSNGTLY